MRHLTYLLIVIFSLPGCNRLPSITNQLSMGSTIIAFGDSLTQGYGITVDQAYPALVSDKLGQSVINAGVSGDTTRTALKRLKADVLDQDPYLVIIQFGGNDAFKNIEMKETFKNIEKMIELVHEKGAMVVLVTVRLGVFKDSYLKGYKELAKRRNIILIPDIMKDIIDNPDLKYDTIHPNAEGQKIIADLIYQAIAPYVQ